jgi:Ca2+-binding EF-hand superfamily protein
MTMHLTGHRRFAVAFLATTVVAIAALPVASQTISPGPRGAGSSGDSAKPRADRTAGLLRHLDADNDGKLSLAEVDAFVTKRFDRLDTDHKGYVTLDDFEARQHHALERATTDKRRASIEKSLPRYEAAYKVLNTAGNGHLTKDEYLAASHARFTAADTDKDGKLSLDELRAAKGKAF